jgi:hypothetical protein
MGTLTGGGGVRSVNAIMEIFGKILASLIGDAEWTFEEFEPPQGFIGADDWVLTYE